MVKAPSSAAAVAMEPNPVIAAAMAQRRAAGLAMTFRIPGRADLFTCFAKNDEQKAQWIKTAKVRGWKLEC